jgi:plastocyanin
MTAIDKAAIAWTIAIVAVGVGIAFYGSSGQDLGIGIQAPEGVVRPQTIETPSYAETSPKTDPFADIAAKVKEQSEGMTGIEEKMPTQEKEQMKIEETKQEMEHKGPQTVEVSIPSGTSVPGCEETNECYIPAIVSIKKGDTVTWKNNDSAAHTVTSGSPEDGPSGIFDSSLLIGGGSFEHTFDSSGSYDYFCMVHPWMTGNVQVS